MFDEIDAKFKIAGRPIIFAWGDTIYNPENTAIPPQLLAHEGVHGQRQGGAVEAWWRRYIEDPQFRFDEELPAHVEECRALLARCYNRKERRSCLAIVAKRFAAPLYGVVSFKEARRLLARATS